MTTASLIAMYKKGVITADHTVVECLRMIDPTNPATVLTALPPEIIVRVREFARQYRPNAMITNYGILPASDQVQAADRWIEARNISGPRSSKSNGSDWDNYKMEARVHEILGSAPTDPGQEASRQFMTPYQIAIDFARRFRDDFGRMGRPIGGAGAGNKALTKYIANQLSRRIKAGKITDIEMQFLYSGDLKSLIYHDANGDILATPNDAGHPNSMFRLR
jgi:hypothetical protein